MSHIVAIQTQVRDPAAIRAACERLALPPPTEGSFRLFSGHAAGHAVRLPAWRYPLVCNTATGELRYDDYEGRWGERRHLDAFLQAYAIEKTKLEARRQGHSMTEQPLSNGSVRLTVHVGGAA